ncbi:hypothetical protein ABGB17_36880 [Sphaerisporangium sp. B11E5]|uniref:hypothetical protein n=1 Tax=Sphaerisporangium sp. B11E5 TaxID=3153563 RepID=UPI00325CC9BE
MSIEPVPGSFLAKILDEFGLQWTHLAVFSGLIFSSFGLDKYLNTGAWIVSSIAAFAVAFLFRRDISGNFSLIALSSILLCSCLIALGVIYANQNPGGLLPFVAGNKLLATVYLSFSTTLPLAICILSYRHREELFGASLPTEIRKAVKENIVELAFYKRNQKYEFVVKEVTTSHVVVHSTLSYTVFNRTSTKKDLTFSLTPMRDRVKYTGARIDGRDLDVENPAYRTELGLQIPWVLPPGKGVPVKLEAVVWYRLSDSDLLASYLPTTDFELIIENPFPDLRIAVECLFRSAIQPTQKNNRRRYRAIGGTVPYQGFKLDWFPR